MEETRHSFRNVHLKPPKIAFKEAGGEGVQQVVTVAFEVEGMSHPDVMDLARQALGNHPVNITIAKLQMTMGLDPPVNQAPLPEGEKELEFPTPTRTEPLTSKAKTSKEQAELEIEVAFVAQTYVRAGNDGAKIEESKGYEERVAAMYPFDDVPTLVANMVEETQRQALAEREAQVGLVTRTEYEAMGQGPPDTGRVLPGGADGPEPLTLPQHISALAQKRLDADGDNAALVAVGEAIEALAKANPTGNVADEVAILVCILRPTPESPTPIYSDLPEHHQGMIMLEVEQGEEHDEPITAYVGIAPAWVQAGYPTEEADGPVRVAVVVPGGATLDVIVTRGSWRNLEKAMYIQRIARQRMEANREPGMAQRGTRRPRRAG